MLITARAPDGASFDRGVVGHAWSVDLVHWEARPPLSTPDAGFGHLEVIQVAEVEGRHVMIFSCLAPELSKTRLARGQHGGVWALPIDSPLGPFDLTQANPLTGPEFYSGRLVRDRSNRWVLLAFLNLDADGAFVGGLGDPIPVEWTEHDEGTRSLVVTPAFE
jgi:beta-fructofuranosidase